MSLIPFFNRNATNSHLPLQGKGRVAPQHAFASILPLTGKELLVFLMQFGIRLATPALFCCALFFSPVGMGAQEEMVSLNFVNADIEEVVKAVSQITGRNFLIDPRVKGTINIVSARRFRFAGV